MPEPDLARSASGFKLDHSPRFSQASMESLDNHQDFEEASWSKARHRPWAAVVKKEKVCATKPGCLSVVAMQW